MLKEGQRAFMAGNALIVSVKRRENEIVPHGDTLLQAGDVIVLLCDEGQSREVYGRAGSSVQKLFLNCLAVRSLENADYL